MGQANTGPNGHLDDSGNPDDGRPKPIGGPKPQKRHHLWTKGATRDFLARVKRGTLGYISPKAVVAVTETLTSGAGANEEYNHGEIEAAADVLVEDHLEHGLTTRQAEKLARDFREGPRP